MELPDFNIATWILQTAAMLLTALLIPKLTIDGPIPAFVTVVTLAFINSHVWSTALFFEIPDSATAQAATLLVCNGVIFWIVVKVLPGIDCEGFLPALIAPVVFTVTMMLISRYGSDIDWIALGKAALDWIAELKEQIETPVPGKAPESTQLLPVWYSLANSGSKLV